jgi:hypothetical protein
MSELLTTSVIKLSNQNKEFVMTDTRQFKTIAVKRTTGEWKVFYGFLASTHHDAAVDWLCN